jgi:hypothetical protein
MLYFLFVSDEIKKSHNNYTEANVIKLSTAVIYKLTKLLNTGWEFKTTL